MRPLAPNENKRLLADHNFEVIMQSLDREGDAYIRVAKYASTI
jgi:hypothetical protein